MGVHSACVLVVILSPGLLFSAASAQADDGCRPPCRRGFVCVDSACVSSCNPPCPSGFSCRDRDCVRDPGIEAPAATRPTLRSKPADPLPAEAQSHKLGLRSWPYSLTQNEIRELKSMGCAFSERDREAAAALQRRGFSEKEYLQAYRDAIKLAEGATNRLEQIAVFRAVGLPLADIPDFLAQKGQDLTEYYNGRVFGGRALAVTGWSMVGVSLATFVLGGVLSGTSCRSNPCNGDQGTAGSVLIFSSAITFLVGLPMGIVGSVKMSRWLRGSVLDKGDAEEVIRRRRSSAFHQVTTVAPAIWSNGGALRLSVAF
jgi:hypothetical protein